MNLRFDNPEPEKVLSLIGRIAPDVVTLEEVSAMWDEKLALLASAYPHRILCTGSTSVGVAILSLPAVCWTSAGCSHGGTFAMATVDFGGRPVEVAALHLALALAVRASPRQIDELAPVLGELVGDGAPCRRPQRNAVERRGAALAEAGGLSRSVRRARPGSTAGCRNSCASPACRSTRSSPSGDVVVHAARALEAAGSDHLPVLVEFSLKRRPMPGSHVSGRTARLILNRRYRSDRWPAGLRGMKRGRLARRERSIRHAG